MKSVALHEWGVLVAGTLLTDFTYMDVRVRPLLRELVGQFSRSSMKTRITHGHLACQYLRSSITLDYFAYLTFLDSFITSRSLMLRSHYRLVNEIVNILSKGLMQ